MAGSDPPWNEAQQYAEDPAEAALATLAQVMGRRVTAEMTGNLSQSLFAEATRLLAAVLGFACEGNCPPLLRGRAVIRAAQSPAWHGLVPHTLLGKWFELPALLALFWSPSLRNAFEAARQGARLEFLCALSRVATLEQLGQARGAGPPGSAGGGRGLLRAPWAKAFEAFPDLCKVRTLCAHVRQRCWEDVRDRSRSRSRSRERKKKEKNIMPSETVRFFVKGFGPAEEQFLERHFCRFGSLMELTILRDKKTKRSRGMAFVTLQPEGSYRGKKNTRQMLKDWVLESFHDVRGTRLEVTEAGTKAPEDEERKHEERVDERRKQRLEREMRAVAPRDASAAERLLLSPWAKRWRQEIWQTLPKDSQGPAPWTDPRVRVLGTALWKEAVDYVERTGGKGAQEALALFYAEGRPDAHETALDPWAFMPVADLLLIVGEGLVGITAEGVFAVQVPRDPNPPASGNDLATMDAPSFAPAPVNLTGLGGPLSSPGGPFAGPSRLVERGGSDHEKIFVGGLTQGTTLEMLMGYFSTYGNIVDAVVMVDKVTGKPRGFGFVVFDKIAVVDAVIRDHGRHRIDGKWVDVKRATPQAPPQAPTAAPAPVMVPPPTPAAPAAPVVVAPPAEPLQAEPPPHPVVAQPGVKRTFAEVPPPRAEALAEPAAQPTFTTVAPPLAGTHLASVAVPPPREERAANSGSEAAASRSFTAFSLPRLFLPSATPAQSVPEAATLQAGQYNPLVDMA